MEQGKTLEKLSERDEASGCYINAAKSYKKEFPKGLFERWKTILTLINLYA